MYLMVGIGKIGMEDWNELILWQTAETKSTGVRISNIIDCVDCGLGGTRCGARCLASGTAHWMDRVKSWDGRGIVCVNWAARKPLVHSPGGVRHGIGVDCN